MNSQYQLSPKGMLVYGSRDSYFPVYTMIYEKRRDYRKRKTCSKVCASSGTKIWNSSERKYRCFYHQTRGVRQNGGGKELGKGGKGAVLRFKLRRDERGQMFINIGREMLGIFAVRL